MQKTDAIKLLAIDNKADNLTNLSTVVGKALPHIRVLTATNGRAGIELAAAEDPNVILLDIVMPGMDGFEVCRRLKADERTKDIPVVFLIALKTDTASRVKAIEAGGEGFLANPPEIAELTAQIRAMTKVKAAHRSQHAEKDHLEAMVAELEWEITERKQAQEELRDSERHLQSTLDGLSTNIAVLDEHGKILFTNKAFRDYGAQNGAAPGAVFEGTNYIALCETASGEHSEEAKPFAAGIREVISGKRQFFELEHPCHSLDEKRWFNGRVTPFPGEGPRWVIVAHENITELKRAEARRQEGFDLLKNLAFNISGVIYQYRLYPDGRSAFPYSSEGMYKIYEVTPEEVREDASVVFGRLHPEDHKRVAEAIFESARTLKTFSCEFRIILPKKGLVWGWSQAQPERTEDGGTIWHGAILDITEQKIGKESQDESEKRYRSLVETTSEWLWELDAQGRYTYVSPRLYDILGYHPEEVIGSSPFDYMPADEAQRMKVFFDGIMAARQSFSMVENTKQHRDGRLVFLETNGSPILSPEGTLLGYRGTDRDITKRKRIQESHARLATAVEQASETIVITDAKGDLIYANPAFEKTTGYTREEVLGQNPRLLKSDQHDAEFYRQMWATLSAGKVWRGEMINKRKDGTFYLEEASITPMLDAMGKVINYVGVKRDITEQKKLEDQFLRAQRLESIGTLAGGLAHDLNNALTPIVMSLDLLRLKYPTESQKLNTIEACTRRCTAMVRQLLTFAKGAAGNYVTVNLLHLVKELQQIINSTFPKNIQVAAECDSNLPTVQGDPTQLHQVLLNICVNARDAMPHGGTLTLEAQRVQISAADAKSIPNAEPGNYVALRVRDSGTGISPEILDRILDPFFATKDPDKGTGLGLSSALGILKGHGGFLQVTSQIGQGSMFAAYLPAIAAASDSELLVKTTVEFRGQEETILLIDDEPTVREVAYAVLRRLNFKPLTAIDGVDGLMKAEQHRSELRAIITDLHMPQMDGLTFVRAVRRMLPDLPIVVASGRLEDTMVEEFKTLGVTSRLDKPFTEIQLAETLRNILAPK